MDVVDFAVVDRWRPWREKLALHAVQLLAVVMPEAAGVVALKGNSIEKFEPEFQLENHLSFALRFLYTEKNSKN